MLDGAIRHIILWKRIELYDRESLSDGEALFGMLSILAHYLKTCKTNNTFAVNFLLFLFH